MSLKTVFLFWAIISFSEISKAEIQLPPGPAPKGPPCGVVCEFYPQGWIWVWSPFCGAEAPNCITPSYVNLLTLVGTPCYTQGAIETGNCQ
jgi:hypothetical protein